MALILDNKKKIRKSKIQINIIDLALDSIFSSKKHIYNSQYNYEFQLKN